MDHGGFLLFDSGMFMQRDSIHYPANGFTHFLRSIYGETCIKKQQHPSKGKIKVSKH